MKPKKTFLMRVLLLLLLLICICCCASANFNECRYSAKQIEHCAQRNVDTNGDGVVTLKEIRSFMDRSLYFWEKTLAWFANMSPEKIVKNCGDGIRITLDSFSKQKESCLNSCDDVGHFMDLCLRLDS